MDAWEQDGGELQAKIIYFGPEGSGTSENVRYIYEKLRPEYRGELVVHAVSGDPSAAFEFLPIELGKVRGRKTSLHLYTVPGGPAHAGLRRSLCEDVVGVVFVADLRPTRHQATLEALEELRGHMAAQGRSLDDLVLILQYNRRDLADENAIDALHRALRLRPSETFDTVASEGTGVLQTLTSLSKTILRHLRQPPTAAPAPEPARTEVAEPGRATVAVEAQPGSDPNKTLEIERVGPAEAKGNEVRLPLRLVDPGSGRHLELCLKLTVEPA